MKIIISKKVSNKIYKHVKEHSPNETKGALFAKKLNDKLYIIEDVYIEKSVGSIVFVKLYNNKRYKNYQKQYHLKNNNDYENHNYIGDWHSHPLFECKPSLFDIAEVLEDLAKSNAKFLIQVIVKIEDNKLVGNAFLYNQNQKAKKIDLVIE